ncbi:MAG: hypothetical protein ACYC7D_00155 [Nitrososphaerales archaeon]
MIGQPSAEERNVASAAIPSAPAQADLAPSQEGTLISKFLVAGESILWKRSFSKGVFNRHLTFTEVVTNIRAASIDDEQLKLIGYVPLRISEISVDKERREYDGMHTGVGTHGVYTGLSSGQSVMYGNVNFIANGKIILTFYNVRDPQGLKNLVTASKKSST